MFRNIPRILSTAKPSKGDCGSGYNCSAFRAGIYPPRTKDETFHRVPHRIQHNIETLFAAPQSQIALAREETAQIHDEQSLKLVENAAQDIDSLLQTAAKEALTGHQYLNVVIGLLFWLATMRSFFRATVHGHSNVDSHSRQSVKRLI